MTGKLLDIGNNDSLLILPCLATNATSLLDGVASDIALERPQFQRIILNYYGPNTIIGSLHVNVLDTLTAREIHRLDRDIATEMFLKHGIILTVGIYAINTKGKLGTLQKDVMTFINNQPNVLQSHGFYYYSDKNLVTIDIIPNESVHDDNVFAEEMKEKLNKQFPAYKFSIVIDHNYTEES